MLNVPSFSDRLLKPADNAKRIMAGFLGLTLGFGGTDLLVDKAFGGSAEPSRPVALTNGTPAADQTLYRNCDAVRAAGAAAIRRGEPGYGPHLDRDGDGVGCE